MYRQKDPPLPASQRGAGGTAPGLALTGARSGQPTFDPPAHREGLAMDQRDIDDMLLRHRRRRRRPWRCGCGRWWWSCTPRREAERQRVHVQCRNRLDDVIARMRTQPTTEATP